VSSLLLKVSSKKEGELLWREKDKKSTNEL